ncbi:BTB/POZ domain-containing protein 17 isoform X2 [Danio rerio]|uniref:BTB/POZ domain-containing protein 17 isoform X2 n=1 Tax=Danio rerio TaxID=7955 RepID=A0A8M9Q0X6_DANRE|nr:BTB/POZ domain-containing protein 17-like isoform X2 [Danio rerio]XP_021327040.1 BTB/POZ domain-containing protein 17-like isoform X2 [Danio rerio]|eukprot:XP_017210224.1 BTB/POZ domain-containing protein 17-like isoform X2 [Danio rerio]
MLSYVPASYIKSVGQAAHTDRETRVGEKKHIERNKDNMVKSGGRSVPVVVCLASLCLALCAGALKPDVLLDNTATTLNHSMALVQRMEALLTQGNGSDVVLRVQTVNTDEVKVIQVHSLVLTLQSDVFDELLQTRNSTAMVLKETSDCAAVFEKFVRYLYCGDITVRLNQAIPLHKLATKYHVWDLQQGLTQYMTQHLSSDSPAGHVVAWYQYATQIGDVTLQNSCLQYLSWNLSSVLQSAEWSSVSGELLLSLLQRSDLVLQSELELYEALEAWINQNQPSDETAENALKAIRYAMISPQNLFHLQKKSPLMLKYYESVRDLLFLAFQFHAASPIQLAKYYDVNCSLFTPRNYLSLSWGSPWVINNPTRDDRSFSFQTQLGPSGHDVSKRITWNALFSPRWLPLSVRSSYPEQGSMLLTRTDAGRPRIIVTPATSSPDFAGVSFQKTVIVSARKQGKVVVRHVYNFHQSTEEAGDFLLEADLQRRASEYLIDSSLYLHIIVKPLYHTLIVSKK